MVKCKVTGGFEQAKLKFQADLETIILNQLEDMIIPQAKKDIEALFEKTFQNWLGGNRPTGSKSDKRRIYSRPHVYLKHEIDTYVDDDGAHIKFSIEATAVYAGTTIPHRLWYWLDFGTDGHTWQQSYPSAWFAPLSQDRTTPNELEVHDSPKFIAKTGKNRWLSKRAKVENGILFIRYLQGDEKAGIKKRNWSKLIAKEIKKTNRDWDITYDVRNPF